MCDLFRALDAVGVAFDLFLVQLLHYLFLSIAGDLPRQNPVSTPGVILAQLRAAPLTAA
jgi:hypothetical protein